MSIDLILKPSCGSCGSAEELYGSTCKHLTLCVSCGKSLAEKRSKCDKCGALITRLIREYNVRTNSCNDKNYFIARFSAGLPTFKKKDGNKWSLRKEGRLPGLKVTEASRERFKNRPWLLEDETGQFQYHGRLEGIQAATYYILMRRRKELVAIPACSWYNFNKVPKYKQLTMEEAEEKMKKSKSKKSDGSKRLIMKAACTGDGDKTNLSDRGEEDEEEEIARKSSADDDNEEGAQGGDLDVDDDIEKGDDWEHDEVFSDDDETLNVYPNELEDLASDPEIEQDDEDEDEDDTEDEAHEEEGAGGLSKSGKDMKKLLGQANRRMKDYDAKNDNDIKEALKEEPVDNISPLKATTSTAGRRTPSASKSSKGKRKGGREESKTPTGGPPLKKVKKIIARTPASSKIILVPETGPVRN